MEEKLEYTKMRERVEWAKVMLREVFGGQIQEKDIMHEACEIARTMFVRSEIQYSGRKA